jgi:hypothetical protein
LEPAFIVAAIAKEVVPACLKRTARKNQTEAIDLVISALLSSVLHRFALSRGRAAQR